jgi:hypothetical protein
MTTGYVCAACGTPVPDLAGTACPNCGVDFAKVAPTVSPVQPWPTTTRPADGQSGAAGWRLPAEYDPSWASRPWWRRHWRLMFGLTIIAIIVAIYGIGFAVLATMMAAPTQRIDAELSEGSGGRIVNTFYLPGVIAGGNGRFILMVTPDVTSSEARTLVCTVVKPTLAREGYQDATFELDSGNVPLATSDATCP